MLIVNNLTKKYHKTIANDDLTFDVPEGQVSILLGPNGAGKSTAIKAIAGLLRFSGKITINGHDNKSIEAKRYLGYIPESPSVYELLTVEEHLQFIAKAYSLKSGWEQYANELLSRFELDDKRTKFGKELSKGMHQKVSICCALLPRPKLLLVDEPMVGLDPRAIKELKNIFIEERESGTALLISTHLLSSVEDLWDQALILVDGKFAARRTRADVDASGESLEHLFFSITEGKGGAMDQ
ncbi:MAG: ABC transporter ATP-binding protein [Christensenellales bacterium]|jgi:ABC-2 type transport system ATP-binding protein